jgi:hypothetical protein
LTEHSKQRCVNPSVPWGDYKKTGRISIATLIPVSGLAPGEMMINNSGAEKGI